MAMKVYRSRVHFLVAKEAPVVVVLQRKRAKLFHVVTIDAVTQEVQEGSWFEGRIYRKRCDVSFDGKYNFHFRLDAYPGLLEDAQWANWDSLGNLWVARPGTIEKYHLADLPERRPSFTLDLERLERPAPAG